MILLLDFYFYFLRSASKLIAFCKGTSSAGTVCAQQTPCHIFPIMKTKPKKTNASISLSNDLLSQLLVKEYRQKELQSNISDKDRLLSSSLI